ncbi:MAG: serine hydrolase domain-containing protein, partial [Verrucomicrobiota bacterium]
MRFLRVGTALGTLLLLAGTGLCARAASLSLPRSTPERQGIPSGALLAAVDALDRMEQVHSLMVVRHGHVVAEGWWGPYDAETPHELFSLSKSFTSTAVGLAVAEGLLRVDDPVLRHLADDAPSSPGPNLRAMRVRDLLTMTSGHQDEPPVAPGLVSARSFLAHPVPHKPGTHFKYNTPATFLQSALVQKVTGTNTAEYLRPRLFEPLGITGARWDTNFQGINLGGYGLRLRTEDIAKFGQLCLQRGVWQGRRVVPEAWVHQATSRQVSNGSNPDSDWEQGYGFQFWRCQHGAYRGDGAFGQFCVVLPAQDAVIAVTAGVGDMAGLLDRLWDTLLPAFHKGPLKADAAARERLERRLLGLRVATPPGAATAPAAASVRGKTYRFTGNDGGLESLSLDTSGPEGWVLTRTFSGKTESLRCGHGRWMTGRGLLGDSPKGASRPLPEESLAASAAWTSDDTWTVKICATGTPFQTTHALRFTGDEVEV